MSPSPPPPPIIIIQSGNKDNSGREKKNDAAVARQTHIETMTTNNNNWAILGVIAVSALTAYGFVALASLQQRPTADLVVDDVATVEIVFWSSWITCAATGLGILPFLFVKHFEHKWIAVGNCIAAGMMIAASVGLLEEGVQGGMEDVWRVAIGFLVGIVFIWQSKQRLDSSHSFDEMMVSFGGRAEVGFVWIGPLTRARA